MIEHRFPDGSTALQSPEALKQDALMMDFKPGNIVITSRGKTVQIVSWPYHSEPEEDGVDQAGDPEMYRCALVKVRTEPNNPDSLVSFNYYSLIRMIEEGTL